MVSKASFVIHGALPGSSGNQMCFLADYLASFSKFQVKSVKPIAPFAPSQTGLVIADPNYQQLGYRLCFVDQLALCSTISIIKMVLLMADLFVAPDFEFDCGSWISVSRRYADPKCLGLLLVGQAYAIHFDTIS